MIFNVSAAGADSGGFELISKTALSAAAASVDIPLPTGYSRYRLESFGGAATKGIGSAVISLLKSNTSMTATRGGGIVISKDIVPDSGNSDGAITASKAVVLKTVTDIIGKDSGVEIHTAAQYAVSGTAMKLAASSALYSDMPDTVRFSSSDNIASGAIFYLWGMKS